MPPTRACSPATWCCRIGNKAVRNPADVQAGVAEAKKGGRKSVLLLVAPARAARGFVAVDIGKT